MQLALSLDALKAFLLSDSNCEEISEDEYVADMYEVYTPMTLNLKLNKEGAQILAAARLIYDATLDAWYMGERIEDEELILRTLTSAMEAKRD